MVTFLISFLPALLVSHPQLSHIAPASSHPPSLMPRRLPRTGRLTGISPSSSCCFFGYLCHICSPPSLQPCSPALPPPPTSLSIHPCLIVNLSAFIKKKKEKERETHSRESPLCCLFPVVRPGPRPHRLLGTICCFAAAGALDSLCSITE